MQQYYLIKYSRLISIELYSVYLLTFLKGDYVFRYNLQIAQNVADGILQADVDIDRHVGYGESRKLMTPKWLNW